jgi:hypothetical protein
MKASPGEAFHSTGRHLTCRFLGSRGNSDADSPSDCRLVVSGGCRKHGIDPSRKKYAAIKSRVHWRADLGKIAREIVECAGVGVCTSDYGQLTFSKLRRPVFPLDLDLQWNRPA